MFVGSLYNLFSLKIPITADLVEVCDLWVNLASLKFLSIVCQKRSYYANSLPVKEKEYMFVVCSS